MTEFILLMILLILIALYFIYQLKRNDAVFEIRSNWLARNDKRHGQYTYDEMFDPSKCNLYGLKYPRDYHFVNKEQGKY